MKKQTYQRPTIINVGTLEQMTLGSFGGNTDTGKGKTGAISQ